MSSKSHFFNRSLGLPFIATFRTTSANESVILPYDQSGEYSGTIYWGDGTITPNNYDNRSHTYLIEGDYDITIKGLIKNFRFGLQTSATQIIDLKQFGDNFYPNRDRVFGNCTNLNITAIDTPNLSESLTLELYFYLLGSIQVNNLNNWNVSNIVNMQTCFANTNVTPKLILSNWDTSNVTSIRSCFTATSNNSYDVTGLDVSNVTDMRQMLERSTINQDISNWNTSNVQDMSALFDRNFAFNQDISNWDFSGLNSNGLTNGSRGFMGSKSSSNYDANYYDNLLIKWAKDPTEGGLPLGMIGVLNMNGIKYTSLGASARQSILDNKGFTSITDGGQV